MWSAMSESQVFHTCESARVPSLAATMHRGSCHRCPTCSRCSKVVSSRCNAAAGQETLTRALVAEAEVRRLRSLFAAVYALSRESDRCDRKRHESHQTRSGVVADEQRAKRCRASDTEETPHGHVSTIARCSDILYTQDSCSNVFGDGTHLESVVQQLIAGDRDPLSDPWFVLDVVEWSEQFYSVDNRRLYCLHRYQEHLGDSTTVHVRIRLHRWLDTFDRFWLHFTTSNGGKSIRIRS